jgi:hypothetical protein
MGVGLMAYVPDNSVSRSLIAKMQGYCELDTTQARAEVPATFRNGFKQIFSKLIRYLG